MVVVSGSGPVTGTSGRGGLVDGDGVAAGLHGATADLDRLLTGSRVLVVVGPGGVGKTTMAAALGLRAAARHGRRVVVVTVDPARRLAEALGVARLTEEPILVPAGGKGRMWALMVDMAESWDRVVEATSPDPDTAERLLANRLYHTLTRRFIQSHDYIALDHLLSLEPRLRHDLVIVDTPPSGHAFDVIDAPGRMIEFFDSRLLRWLTAGAGSGLSGAAARPFLAVAERLLGGRFLADIVEFFTLFSRLRPGFVERSRRVDAQLGASDTSFVVVSTTEPAAVEGCDDLVEGLTARDRSPGLVVVNRLLPALRLDRSQGGHRLRATLTRPVDGTIEDRSLAAAVDDLLVQAERARLPEAASTTPTVAVPVEVGDLTSVAGLRRLLADR